MNPVSNAARKNRRIIRRYCRFRKNEGFFLFYLDMPKGFQISQYKLPLCRDGFLTLDVDDATPGAGVGEIQTIHVRCVHLEEDTGKLTNVDGYSLVDFNRAGVPLMEIVSEADMRSANEAYA